MTVRDELQRIAEAIVDGTASAADRERLAALLAGSPAAREVWADLEAARTALEPAGLATPPADLRDSILAAVAATPREARPAPAWWQAIARSLELRPASRLAWGMAALLAVAVISVAAITGQFGAGRDLAPSTVATLSPEGDSDASQPPAPGAPAPAPAPAPGPRVEATAVREAQGVRVSVDAHGAGGSDVSVTWDADAALVRGFRWTRGAGDAPSLEPGRVITHVAADAAFEFLLAPTGPALPELKLHLRSGDREQVQPLRITAR